MRGVGFEPTKALSTQDFLNPELNLPNGRTTS